MKYAYSDLPPTDLICIQAEVSAADYALIKQLSLQRGLLQNTISQFWSKLCARCRADGISNFTQGVIFDAYVENLELPPIIANPNGNEPKPTPVENRSHADARPDRPAKGSRGKKS